MCVEDKILILLEPLPPPPLNHAHLKYKTEATMGNRVPTFKNVDKFIYKKETVEQLLKLYYAKEHYGVVDGQHVVLDDPYDDDGRLFVDVTVVDGMV